MRYLLQNNRVGMRGVDRFTIQTIDGTTGFTVVPKPGVQEIGSS